MNLKVLVSRKEELESIFIGASRKENASPDTARTLIGDVHNTGGRTFGFSGSQVAALRQSYNPSIVRVNN